MNVQPSPIATLSANERQSVSGLVKALYRKSSFGLSRTLLQQLQEVASHCWKSNHTPHDEFGLLKIDTALRSLCLANEEIGITCTAAAIAYALRNVGWSGQKELESATVISPQVREAFQCFERAESFLSNSTKIINSDSFRNLFVAECGDMRVMLLLLAETVCKMRQLRDTPRLEARQLIAQRAAVLFAPLAHKLGLYAIKSELEDLSLKYLESEAYYHIKNKLSATKQARDAYIEAFIAPLQRKMDAEHISCHIKGRTKSIHSIWQKMKKQKCEFEGVYDLFAIRIIIDSPNVPAKDLRKKEVSLCWNVYSLVTSDYETNPKRLRDWLSVPKSNGYESLHITLLGPENKWVEVQIRTSRMDDIAEHGLAAHWRYKGIKSASGNVDNWLSSIRGALEAGDEQQLQHQFSAGFKDNHVYVFSPKGDLYQLCAGATVLDFAYHIHSNVGNHCIGARINGRNIPIRQQLQNGQRVEIVTSNAQEPRTEWLQIVASSRAKAKIKAALGKRQEAASRLVHEELDRKFKRRKLEWNDGLWNQMVRRLGYKEIGDLYKDIAEGKTDLNKVIETYESDLQKEHQPLDHQPLRKADEYALNDHFEPIAGVSDDVVIIDKNVKGLDFRAARCCNPVYGDKVFGFVTVNGGITIHRMSCPNAPSLRARFPYRIVRAQWAGKGLGKYPVTLRVVGKDDLGIVNNITSIISKEEHVLLRSVNIESHDGLFSGLLTIMIDDTQLLTRIVKKLQTVKGIKSVSRT